MSLNVRTIRSLVNAERPGMWAARNGLNLVIASSGTPSWALRYSTRDGKRRLMKLADYQPVDAAELAALEADAAEHRKAIKAGHDPLAERAAPVAPSKSGNGGETFKAAALAFIEENRAGWKNDKHQTQWENTLASYAYPLIGDKLTHEITMEDVKGVLQQPYARGEYLGTLWGGARETAARLRSRIETVINATKAAAVADNSNPARQALWSNHHNPAERATLKYAGLNGKQVRSHYRAMDWKDVPAFAAELAGKTDYSARALLLTILCATRTSETLCATWGEFDLDAAMWTIPAERMKAGKEHRVPLSAAAVQLLRGTPQIEGNPHVFPGVRANRPLSNMAMLEALRGMRPDEGLTVHGFRSAFRDWINETTLHPDAIAEQALAHTIDNRVERAYRRGDAFERRRDLMAQWSDYLTLDGAAYGERWRRFIA
jgi:integrase